MRDINHGPMRFYYSMGYVGPAVVVALAVGVRAHQYGNFYLYVAGIGLISRYYLELFSAVGCRSMRAWFGAWWVQLVCSHLPISASCFYQSELRLQYKTTCWVLGILGKCSLFVDLFDVTWWFFRTLLWVSVIALPLLGITWVLALLAASERHPLLMPFLSAAVLVHAAFSLAGYCFANNRVRQNLLRYFSKTYAVHGHYVKLLQDFYAMHGQESTFIGHPVSGGRSEHQQPEHFSPIGKYWGSQKKNVEEWIEKSVFREKCSFGLTKSK